MEGVGVGAVGDGSDEFPFAGAVRRARRIADLSQRELARAAGVSQAAVSRIEAGALRPSVALLRRVLAVAGLLLVVVDQGGQVVEPMADWDDTRDGAERRYPSHLDTILDPEPDEWWGDKYGLMRPPETFRRDRLLRDMQRARSQWEVRVAKYRFAPPPPDPWLRPWREYFANRPREPLSVAVQSRSPSSA
jgi:transcriptional regulator with XRE-family HTH domain